MYIVNIYTKHDYKKCVYKQIDTGRFHTVGLINEKRHEVLINYQGLKKRYRKDIFKDFYEYDINTAAPTILHQMYINDIGSEFESIKDYIANKKERREEFALILNDPLLDANIKKVKHLLTALFFGANLIRNKISEKLEKEISQREYKLLKSNSKFKQLCSDTNELFRKLAKKHVNIRSGFKKCFIKNDIGKKVSFTKKEKNKAIAFLYQGIEAKILLAVFEEYKDDVALMIHDCIIVKDKIEDINELSRIAKEASGYDVIYEEEKFE